MSDQSPQSKGGEARRDALTPERRTEIAVTAASARWSKQPVQELFIPLGELCSMVARIPFPITQQDFDLLVATLVLWKTKLVIEDPKAQAQSDVVKT